MSRHLRLADWEAVLTYAEEIAKKAVEDFGIKVVAPRQNESVRTAVGIEARFNAQDPSVLDYAAGFYIEAFPDLEDKDINLIEVIVQNLPKFCDMYKADKGFDLDEVKQRIKDKPCSGISNLYGRVSGFNGRVDIESSPGNGVKITILIDTQAEQ